MAVCTTCSHLFLTTAVSIFSLPLQVSQIRQHTEVLLHLPANFVVSHVEEIDLLQAPKRMRYWVDQNIVTGVVDSEINQEADLVRQATSELIIQEKYLSKYRSFFLMF